MTTDERIENLELVLPSGKRCKRWLLAAVGLGTLAVVWSMGASMLSAEVAPSVQQQPGSDWTMLELLGIITILVLGARCLTRFWRRGSRLHPLKTTINLKCPICGEVMIAPVVPPPFLHSGVKVGQTTTCASCGNASLVVIRSLGGWLFFPALGLILSPLGIIVKLVSAVADYGLGLVFVYPVYIGFFIFDVWAAVVFFIRKPYAPKLIVALLVANVACALITWVAVGTHGDLDEETASYIKHALLYAAIWIPYFLMSRRVKATFSRKGVAWPIQQEGPIVSQGSGSATTPTQDRNTTDGRTP